MYFIYLFRLTTLNYILLQLQLEVFWVKSLPPHLESAIIALFFLKQLHQIRWRAPVKSDSQVFPQILNRI